MQPATLSQNDDLVKDSLVSQLNPLVDHLLAMARDGASDRELELQVWQGLLHLAQMAMGAALQASCQASTERDIEQRGLAPEQVRVRNEEAYWYMLTTTFGVVSFFTFAYRDLSSPAASVTRVPARDEALALHRNCRSSQLCLEWETRLGSEHPFRHAQQLLNYFTHGGVALEDNTIEEHMKCVANLIDREWLYRSPEAIRHILETQATRDTETGRPIMYISTDAHAIRRYVDDTWNAKWKYANGLRLWCVNRRNGAIIHLGGEYTWGDCHKVAEIVRWLIESGHVPDEGDFGEGTVSQLVVITDGLPWIEDHVVQQLPWAQPILDLYHVLDNISKYVKHRFEKSKKQGNRFYMECVELLLRREKGDRKPNQIKRKRPRKTPRRRSKSITAIEGYADIKLPEYQMPGAEMVLELLILEKRVAKKYRQKHENLIEFLKHNLYRTDYAIYRKRGYQIGSGAMESLHRIASQVRLKIPGGSWLPETAQAIFNLRMMALVDKWDDFWCQPGITEKLVKTFEEEARRRKKIHHERQQRREQAAA